MTHRETEQPKIRLEHETRAILTLAEACKHLSNGPKSFRVSELRGKALVTTIKIGRRTWVRISVPREVAGLSPVLDVAGGAT